MMREFRVWCKNKNEWEKHTCYLAENGTLFQVVGGNLIRCSTETHVVQFHTGLRDKNNNKIYEGDILKGNCIVKFGYQEEIFNSFISIGDGEEDNQYILVCGVYLEDKYGGYKTLSNYLDDYNELEIIGNIYKNPELLEKNNA